MAIDRNKPRKISVVSSETEIIRKIMGIYDMAGVHPIQFTVKGNRMIGIGGKVWNIRGIHAAPTRAIVLEESQKTIEYQSVEPGMDFVSFEVGKARHMLKAGNGNSIEDLAVPPFFIDADTGLALREIGKGFITRALYGYYRQFAYGCYRRTSKRIGFDNAMYTYREYLAGIHVMKTGQVLSKIRELLAVEGFASEFTRLCGDVLDGRVTFADYDQQAEEIRHVFEADATILGGLLQDAFEASALPTSATSRTLEALDDYLVELRARDYRTVEEEQKA